MMRWSKYSGAFEAKEGKAPVASISGSIMGYEYTESYFFCHQCGVYAVAMYRDPFCGDESDSVQGPISKADGDAKVEMIRRCSKPWEQEVPL